MSLLFFFFPLVKSQVFICRGDFKDELQEHCQLGQQARAELVVD